MMDGDNLAWSRNLGELEFSEPEVLLAGVPRGRLKFEDVDGDGITDIFVTGFSILRGTGDSYELLAAHASSSSVALGDFNGDGKLDIAWRHATSGQVFVWLMNGTTVMGSGSPGTVADLAWQIIGAGDVDMDGMADIVWRDSNTGTVFVWLMNGTMVSGTGSPGTVAYTHLTLPTVGAV